VLLGNALTTAAAIVAVCLASGALAADASLGGAGAKNMQTDEPMSTKMMKPGMKKGDVKKHTDEKFRVIKPALDKEERSMEQGKPK